jgi:hypothetical protein
VQRQRATHESGERPWVLDSQGLEVTAQRIFWVTLLCQLLPLLFRDGTQFLSRGDQGVLHRLGAVALANKIARIAWKLMVSGETYRPSFVAASAA